ncbi:MAG: hypothetical protein A3H98_08985 [Bacteroidetes bacterium RIFCSPLOWO2_02_FULL_36_8]|nr:MAG: hypothetical protein A3H98_08985 [Bacteroidetes bacterium RIFCSPLOWO2_02_FULL_36_8]OFY70482.1 MAG: hypothetical protein A3G23_10185 [Bacteroidetes bacterium RIFCSPLOWO2_12_FULL_37_12]
MKKLILFHFCIGQLIYSAFSQRVPAYKAIPMFGAGASLVCSWGDSDNDGDKDLLVGNIDSLLLFINSGGLNFQKIVLSTDSMLINFVKWVDLNKDSFPEIVMGT